jgi:hypothetical protein
MKYALIVLIAGLSALPLTARAEGAFISGEQIMRVCNNPKGDLVCTGFIGGALDEVAAEAALRTEICVPSGTTLRTLRTALVKYGRDHADLVKGSGVGLLNAMIKANYPCTGK